MSIFSVITVVLLVLKLIGYFNYSWWLVFAPLIIEIVIITGIRVYFKIKLNKFKIEIKKEKQ